MVGGVDIQLYTGFKLMEAIPELIKLRLKVFAEYPYLYDGKYEDNMQYLAKFKNMEDAVIIVAKQDKQIVGIAMAFPFKNDLENFQKTFISKGRDPKDYFCFGEVIVKKEERKKGISKKLFEALFSYGKSLNKYKYYCFYTIERESDYPPPPKDYPPVKLIWKKQGFQEHAELIGSISYKEIGEQKESPKKMVFWIKKI